MLKMSRAAILLAFITLCVADDCINNRDDCPDTNDPDFARSHDSVLYCCDALIHSSMDLLTVNGKVSSCSCIEDKDVDEYNDWDDFPPLGSYDWTCTNERSECFDLNNGNITQSYGGIIYCCAEGYRLDIVTKNGLTDNDHCACRGGDNTDIIEDHDYDDPWDNFFPLGDDDVKCSNVRDECASLNDNIRSHGGVIYCCPAGYSLDIVTKNGVADNDHCACRS
ncbi:hypothetical protein PoB_003678000 [Plakobranchus ocellatus]|uniref:Uncharacterized protein n=1 Tax=Plakobranchus ocellatus TaxID=259542 RepID=A0AAV4ATP0_9GAST|nr:hypothetical protein PoB_003678000 [Plakobranchus ocellatus]